MSVPPRARSRSTLAFVALILLGLAGYSRAEWVRLGEAGTAPAAGPFWRALDSSGSPVRVVRRDSLRLEDGTVIEFSLGDRAVSAVSAELEFLSERAFVDFEWAAAAGDPRILRVATEGTFGWLFASRTSEGKLARPDQERGPAQIQLFQRASISVSLQEEGARATQGGALGAACATFGGVAREARIRVRGGPILVRSLGLEVAAEAGGPIDRLQDDLSALAEGSRGGEFAISISRVLLIIALLALFLWILAWGAAPAALAIRSAFAWSAPIALWQATTLVWPSGADPVVLLALLVVGFPLALFSMRSPYASVRERGAMIEGVLARWPERGVRAGLAWGLGAVAVALLGVSLIGWRDRLDGSVLAAAAREASRADEPGETTSDGPIQLDAHNAITVGEDVRDADLSLSCFLHEGAVLELRLRGPRSSHPEGVSLIISRDEAFSGGFFVDTREHFSRISPPIDEFERGWWSKDAQPTALGQQEVLVRLRGSKFSASAGGTVAVAETSLYPRGRVTLQALAGQVRVDRFTLTPLPSVPPAPRWPTWMGLVAASLLFFVGYVGFARQATGWPLPAFVAASAIAMIPAVLEIGSNPASGEFDSVGSAICLASTGVLLLLSPMVAGKRLRALPFLAVLAWVLCGLGLTHRDLARRAFPPDDLALSQLTMLDWEGERLEADLIHWQHPLYRRFNEYLVEHQFRGRRHDLKKPDGVTRIVALGTSSTFGYLAKEPYPFRIERALKADGLPVEVIIAAWPGSSATRQLAFLKNVILQFEPDILTVSLFYNDSYQLSSIDEGAYAARVTGAGYTRSWREDLRDRRQATLAERAFRGPGDREERVTDVLGIAPPAAFEEILREIAEVARVEQLDVLFIKEPTANDQRWQDEFYAAIDRVAAASGSLVVDPKPVFDQKGGSGLFFDAVHPTDVGHAVLSELLVPHVRRAVRERQRAEERGE